MNLNIIVKKTYEDIDGILHCFSVVSPESLENIEEKWKKETDYFLPNAPFVLVDLKTDLRDDDNIVKRLETKYGMKPITKEQGEAKAKELGAVKYIECSSKTGENVNSGFEEAARIGLTSSEKIESSENKKKNCVIC